MQRQWSRRADGTINDVCGLSISDGTISYFFNDCGFERIEVINGQEIARVVFEAGGVNVQNGRNCLNDPVLLGLGRSPRGEPDGKYPALVLYSRERCLVEHTFEPPTKKEFGPSAYCGDRIIFSCLPENCYTDYPFSVCCFDRMGKKLWEADVKTSYRITAIDENRFLAYTKDGNGLAAYSATNGEFLYDLDPLNNGKDVSDCMCYGGYIYVTTRNALRIYDDRGSCPVPVTDIIDYENYTILPQRVVPFEDTVFIISSDTVCQYSLDGKERLMEFPYATEGRDRKGMNDVQGGVCVVGNVVCFGSSNHNLWCFNRHTGDLVARVEYKDFVSATPVFDGDKHLVVACYDGTVECFDVSDWL